MKSLQERLEARIEARDVAAPDKPYEMGRVMGIPASGDSAIADLAAQQADKVQEAKEAEDAANSGEKDRANEDAPAKKSAKK